MTAVFAGITPETYQNHALHSPERMWPETNCYLDLWIEVLNACGLPPEAMLGFTLTQDFEGDQFTFFKVPLEDLESLYDIRVTELAIFDSVEGHVQEQIRRGRLCLVEMDSYYLPDTHGTGYHQDHGKTTVGINRLDLAGRTMSYFHNSNYYQLQGEDFDGIFQHNLPDDALPFLPYTEFAKFPAQASTPAFIQAEAMRLLSRHFARRPAANPVRAFAAVFPAQAEALADRPFAAFHKYAFNTLRQLGANFELASAHFDWLSETGEYAKEAALARQISETAKTVQFQLARAVSRRKFEPLAQVLEPAAAAWDQLMDNLGRSLG